MGGTRLAIAPLAGATVRLALPPAIAGQPWSIVALSWALDSSRLAVTVRAGGGIGNEREMYVVAARYGAAWDRVAAPPDAVAGPWIDADRLLLETAGAMVAVADVTKGTFHPLTAMPAVSPMLGADGRAHFVGGAAASGSMVSTLPWASGGIWSSTIEGRDLRADGPATIPFAQPMRLAGLLTDGSAVVVAQGGAFVLGDRATEISSPSGVILRATVASDGRRVVALTPSRVLLVDPARHLPPTNAGSDVIASTVLVGDVLDADAWSPRSAVALASAPTARGPAAGRRFAFVLGRTLWSWSPPADPVPLIDDVPVVGPAWSPRGDRIAATVYPAGRALPVLMRADGTGRIDLDVSGAAFVANGGRGFAWTPEGDLAVQLVLGDRALQYATRIYDPAGGAVVRTIDGRATWSGDRPVVLTDGVLDNDTGNRVEQRVVLPGRDGDRVLTDAKRLAADPLIADLPDRELAPEISAVEATGDPALLGVWLQRQRFGGYASAALVVVQLSDGRARWRLPFTPLDPPRDLAFSPTGTYVGWTSQRSDDRRPETSGTATVVDVAADTTVRSVAGRFAGWSADGATFYVARQEGLFAYRLQGGDPAPVGPYGVPVAAAR